MVLSQQLIPSRPSRSGRLHQQPERERKTDAGDAQPAITRRAASQEGCAAAIQGCFPRCGGSLEERRPKRLVPRNWGSGNPHVSVSPLNSNLMLQYIQYIYQMILNGCRLGFYEPLRKTLTTAIFKDSNVQSLGINIFSGATSGMLGAAIGSPFFLVKTRLQSFSPFLPVGTQHGYQNAMDGFRKINRAEGAKGLYRGVGAAIVRTGFGSSVQLPTYFFAKRRLIKHLGMREGAALHLASSACSGFVVCCVMHPPGMFNRSRGK